MATGVYHFTHKANLATILSEGRLYCDRLRVELGLSSRNIAYTRLKQRRAEVKVDVPPGGYLDQYVPFYFGTRSPMMLTYANGNVTGKKENLDDLIYFVTSVEAIRRATLGFVFTDGHPLRMPLYFSNDVADLQRVDFPLMKQKMWNDTDADPDRMRRRQAEFLVHSEVPWESIIGLGARNTAVAAEVEALIARQNYRPKVVVRPGWYYYDREVK